MSNVQLLSSSVLAGSISRPVPGNNLSFFFQISHLGCFATAAVSSSPISSVFLIPLRICSLTSHICSCSNKFFIFYARDSINISTSPVKKHIS